MASAPETSVPAVPESPAELPVTARSAGGASRVPSVASANTWMRPAARGSPVCTGSVSDTAVLPAGSVTGAVA